MGRYFYGISVRLFDKPVLIFPYYVSEIDHERSVNPFEKGRYRFAAIFVFCGDFS